MKYSCIVIDDEPHAIGAMCDLIERCPQLFIEKTFLNVPDAIEYLNSGNHTDIVFSDINMPNINGLEAAKLLSTFCRFLVFVTAHPDHSLQAYNERAVGFLLKPVGVLELTELINSFIRNDKSLLSSIERDHKDVVFIKGDQKNQFFKLNVSDILYIESDLNYNWVHTTTKKLYTYASLSKLEDKLSNSKLFIKINKSTLLSINHIESIEGNTVFLSNKHSIAIGSVYKMAFHEFIKSHSINS